MFGKSKNNNKTNIIKKVKNPNYYKNNLESQL